MHKEPQRLRLLSLSLMQRPIIIIIIMIRHDIYRGECTLYFLNEHVQRRSPADNEPCFDDHCFLPLWHMKTARLSKQMRPTRWYIWCAHAARERGLMQKLFTPRAVASLDFWSLFVVLMDRKLHDSNQISPLKSRLWITPVSFLMVHIYKYILIIVYMLICWGNMGIILIQKNLISKEKLTTNGYFFAHAYPVKWFRKLIAHLTFWTLNCNHQYQCIKCYSPHCPADKQQFIKLLRIYC